MIKLKSIKITGPKPSGLRIERDAAGVPHIYASDFSGALWGNGYAHAIDRMTQLLMMRILGQGRLCELLDDSEESLAIDTFFRRAHWTRAYEDQLSLLDAKSLALCQSYCDGVNAGLAAKKMSVLKLLGYEPEPWKVQDMMLISRMASYLTLAQSQAEVEKFFIELTQSGVATELLAELFPIDVNEFDRDLIEKVKLEEKLVPSEVIWNLALPRMMASNNWVVAADKTESGEALMANDPHLEVNRLPNVWCEQSLKWDDNYMLGMGMPGMPGILIGRTKHVSWGATYTFMDTIDSWVEDCKEGKYRKGKRWYKFEERKELIKRKSSPDEEIVFYENGHGVLEGNPHQAGHYLATSWIAANSGARSLKASLRMPCVKNAEEAMNSLGKIESGWNWVIADNHKNIAYQMSGLMPKRKQGWNGFTPAPGWDASYDWQGVVDVSELPHCLNPECGYIVTANQDLNHLGVANPINMPMGTYRAERIAEVLEAGENHSIESTQALQMDVYSNQAKLFLDRLLPLIESDRSHVSEVLRSWDFGYDYESIGAPIFEEFYSQLRLVVFGEQEVSLGKNVIEHLSNETGLFIDFYQNFDRVLLDPESSWFQDISQEQAFVRAFDRVKNEMAEVVSGQLPKWREINTITFTNILFQGKLPRVLGFDSEPTALLGGRATPHQGQVYRAGGRDTSFAPSVRIVADMATPNLKSSVAGGPSDNRLSPWYKSSLQDWLDGVYKTLEV